MKKLTMVLLLFVVWAASAWSQDVKIGDPKVTGITSDRWIVGWRPTVSKMARPSRANAYHGVILNDYRVVPVSLVQMNKADADRMKMDPSVRYVVPDFELKLDDTTPCENVFNVQWGLKNTGQKWPADTIASNYYGIAGDDIDAVKAWDIETGDSTLKIGLIDSGIDYNHPDLANNVWTNPGETPGNGIDDDGNGYIDDVHGYVATYAREFPGDNDPMDYFGHGTHTGGIIAARGNNCYGLSGVAWKAEIVPIKVFDDCGGSGFFSNIVEGVQYALDNHIKLTSNSYGETWTFDGHVADTSYYFDPWRDLIAATSDSGMLYIAAAGNNDLPIDSLPLYEVPAGLKPGDNIVSVAASTSRDSRAVFSNYGSGRVDLAAPGFYIGSTWPAHHGGGFVYESGTSMACPMVTGVAALIWSKYPYLSYKQVKAMLLAGVDQSPYGDAMTGTYGTYDFYGDYNGVGPKSRLKSGGRLNAYNSLLAPKGAISQSDIAGAVILGGAGDLAWTCTVRDSGGVPVPGVDVVIDFSSSDSVRIESGGSVYNCTTKKATVTTDSYGVANFNLCGQVRDCDGGLATLTVDGAGWGGLHVSALDLNENGQVDGGDLSVFTGLPTTCEKVDADGDGSYSGNDLSVWLNAYSNTSGNFASSFCSLTGPQMAPSGAAQIAVPASAPPTTLLVAESGGRPELWFSLSSAGPAKVEVFDVAGRKVADLFDGSAKAGVTRLRWSTPLPPGAYFARFTAGAFRQDKKIAVVR